MYTEEAIQQAIDGIKWKADGTLPNCTTAKHGGYITYQRAVPHRYKVLSDYRFRFCKNIGAADDRKSDLARAWAIQDLKYRDYVRMLEERLQREHPELAKKPPVKKHRGMLEDITDPFNSFVVPDPSEMSIYIMTNPAMKDGWIKIGESNNADRRAKEFNTSAPADYVVEFSFPLPEGKSDKDAHEALRREAIKSKREWFLMPIARAKQVIFNEIYKEEERVMKLGVTSSIKHWHLSKQLRRAAVATDTA